MKGKQDHRFGMFSIVLILTGVLFCLAALRFTPAGAGAGSLPAAQSNRQPVAPAGEIWRPMSLMKFFTPANGYGVSGVRSSVPTSLTGTFTVGPGGNYPTFTAAINDLNRNGVGSGGVTFNVLVGTVFNENPPAIRATGTAANQIIFQKFGQGPNPIIRASGGVGNFDYVIAIVGGDYLTINGIDLSENGSAVEFGVLIINSSATDGAQHNTIENLTTTLNRINLGSVAIEQLANGTGGSLVPTTAAGANSGNVYKNLIIRNVYSGISLSGNASFPDDSNQVTSCTIGDSATANDIGNGFLQTFGVRATSEANVTVSKNQIENVTGT